MVEHVDGLYQFEYLVRYREGGSSQGKLLAKTEDDAREQLRRQLGAPGFRITKLKKLRKPVTRDTIRAYAFALGLVEVMTKGRISR